MNINYDKAKVVQVEVSKLKNNPLNPRQSITFEHIDSVAVDGIRKPVIVGLDMTIYQGHCRTACAKFNSLKTIPAIVIDDSKMSLEEKLNLLIDHSSEKPLNKSEAYKACKEYFLLGYGEADVARRCICILNTAFGSPASSKIEEAVRTAKADNKDVEVAKQQCYFKKHRGTLQNMSRLASLPDYVGKAYMEKWDGTSDLITQGDVKALHDSFTEARKGKEESINRDNPPKGFKQEFDALVEINSKENKGDEPIRMKSKADIEKLLEVAKNATVVTTLKWVLGQITKDAEFRKIAVGK